MPRNRIELEPRVEYLSILDASGKVDSALEPDLDPDFLRRMYRLMLATRRLDERMLRLQRQGRIGTYGPVRGQEAAHVASCLALHADDWLVPSFREMGTTLARGWPMEANILFWGGYERGCAVPAGVNDLPICVPVASQTLHAVGIAWGMKLDRRPNVVLCYLGDGATSEGDFHEAMNFAGVFGLPIVFLIQNNHFAISLPRRAQTLSATLAQKAVAYGFDGIQVDGNDALAVYTATSDAVDQARAGQGPTLIEAVTYRLIMHTTADDPKKYRSDDEVQEWEGKDPLPRLATYLVNKKILDADALETMEGEVIGEIKAAVERYEAARDVDPLEMFANVYAEPPAELIAQREELRGHLEREGSGT